MKIKINKKIKDYEFAGRLWNEGDEGEFPASLYRILLAHKQEIGGEAVPVFIRIDEETEI